MKSKKIYIRTDFGNVIGDGHLFRTKALASELLKLTDNLFYVIKPHEGCNLTKIAPYNYISLNPASIKNPDKNNYAEWLSSTELEDATECLAKTSCTDGDIWIVDHYGINSEWELHLRKEKQIVIAIDDLFRQHACDALIDHNLTASMNKYIEKSLNPFTKYFIGPQFALLREEILKSKKYSPGDCQEKILIYLGTAPSEIFLKVQRAIRATTNVPIHYLSPPLDTKLLENEKIIPFQNDIISIYQNYKLIVGSCGVANLERMAFSVPTITCGVVNNQKDVSDFISVHHPLMHLGMIQDIPEEELISKLNQIFQLKPEEIIKNRIELEKLVAKNGVSEIAKFISKQLHQTP